MLASIAKYTGESGDTTVDAGVFDITDKMKHVGSLSDTKLVDDVMFVRISMGRLAAFCGANLSTVHLLPLLLPLYILMRYNPHGFLYFTAYLILSVI